MGERCKEKGERGREERERERERKRKRKRKREGQRTRKTTNFYGPILPGRRLALKQKCRAIMLTPKT